MHELAEISAASFPPRKPSEMSADAQGERDALLRPVPKRARDPLATGAIFRASPAALRSPMPRVLQSPQSRVVASASGGVAQGVASPGSVAPRGQPSAGGAAGRFGHLSSRFDELYSKSPMPKVLLGRKGAQAAGAPGRGADATFVTPSPRAPAPKKPAPAAASGAGARPDPAGSPAERGLRTGSAARPLRDRASAAATRVASPSAMSEDMDIDDIDDAATPPLPHAATPPLPRAADSAPRGGRRAHAASGGGAASSARAASSRRAHAKETPPASSAGNSRAEAAVSEREGRKAGVPPQEGEAPSARRRGGAEAATEVATSAAAEARGAADSADATGMCDHHTATH